MHRLNITGKIWLSVGVFILGYMLSTALSQIQGREARALLRATSEALFPAAQRSQEAESAFQRMVKGFGDAVIMQDASGLDRAAADGQQAVAAINSVASIPGLSAERSANARKLTSALDQVLGDARTVYGAVLGGSMTSAAQEQIRALASRIDQAMATLTKTKEQSADDLKRQLNLLEKSSASPELVRSRGVCHHADRGGCHRRPDHQAFHHRTSCPRDRGRRRCE